MNSYPPRTPIPPGPERDEEVSYTLRKAYSKLLEAEAADPETTPGSIIHQSYYALFHLVRAVFLHRTGTHKSRHQTLQADLGDMAREEQLEVFLSFHTKVLAAAAARTEDDYNNRYYPTLQEADETRKSTREVFDRVIAHCGLKVPDMTGESPPLPPPP